MAPLRDDADDWDDDADDGDDDSDGWEGDDSDEEPTVPCPYCRREILEDSPWCPSCDRYISAEEMHAPTRPTWVIITALVCLAIAVWWAVASF